MLRLPTFFVAFSFSILLLLAPIAPYVYASDDSDDDFEEFDEDVEDLLDDLSDSIAAMENLLNVIDEAVIIDHIVQQVVILSIATRDALLDKSIFEDLSEILDKVNELAGDSFEEILDDNDSGSDDDSGPGDDSGSGDDEGADEIINEMIDEIANYILVVERGIRQNRIPQGTGDELVELARSIIDDSEKRGLDLSEIVTEEFESERTGLVLAELSTLSLHIQDLVEALEDLGVEVDFIAQTESPIAFFIIAGGFIAVTSLWLGSQLTEQMVKDLANKGIVLEDWQIARLLFFNAAIIAAIETLLAPHIVTQFTQLIGAEALGLLPAGTALGFLFSAEGIKSAFLEFASRTFLPGLESFVIFIIRSLTPANKVLLYFGNGGMGPNDETGAFTRYFTLQQRYEAHGLTVDYTDIFPANFIEYRLVILIGPGRDDDSGTHFFSSSQVNILREFTIGGGRLVVLGDHSGAFGINTLNNLLDRLSIGIQQNPNAVTPDADSVVPLTDITPDFITINVVGYDPAATSSLSLSAGAKSLVRNNIVSPTGQTVLAVDQVPGAPSRPCHDVVVSGDLNFLDDFMFSDPAGDGDNGILADNLIDCGT